MQRKDSRQSALASQLTEELKGTPEAIAGDSGLFNATVAGISGSDVIIELGPRVQGAVSMLEFDEAPALGSTLKVVPTGKEETLWLFSSKKARSLASWEEMELGSLVKGKVIGVNKGGLELKVSGVNAFMPASQIALNHVEDLFAYVGQTMLAEVKEMDRDKGRIVISRRAVLMLERQAKTEEAVGGLVEGSVMSGKVTRVESFGAFVDLGGVEGLLHVSNISHKRVEDPNEVLSKGQDVRVMLLKIEDGGRRIGLGMKQLEADPWDEAVEKLREDTVVEGKIVRVQDFGAFVELLPGVDGLLHVSQLGQGRVNRASDVLKVGEELSVRIESIDPMARRISLSRLDSRGAVLGSDEAVDGADINAVIDSGQGALGTSLGSLFANLKKKDS